MKISEMMNYISDDSVSIDEINVVSSEVIKEETMKKINKSNEKAINTKLGISKKSKRRIIKPAVAAAAVMIMGTVSVFAMNIGGVSDSFQKFIFGRVTTQKEQAVFNSISFGNISEDENVIENNGTKVIPEDVIFDGRALFLKIKIIAPKDVCLDTPDKNVRYSLRGDGDEPKFFPGYNGSYSGGEIEYVEGNQIKESYTINGNEIEMISEWRFHDEVIDMKDLPKVFHFDGIYEWKDDVDFEGNTPNFTRAICKQVIEGNFDISLEGIAKNKKIIVDTKEFGKIEITPLGCYFLENTYFSYEQIEAFVDKEIFLKLNDGSIVKEKNDMWEKLVDVNMVDEIMVNNSSYRVKK